MKSSESESHSERPGISEDDHVSGPIPTLRPPSRSPSTFSPSYSPSLYVRVLGGAGDGTICDVGLRPLSIGTAPSNALCLSDRHVSRVHCEVFLREGHYFVRDLGSTNGTYLDGTRVVEAILPLHGSLRVGETTLALAPSLASSPTKPEAPLFGMMVGTSKAMQQVFHGLRSVAQSPLTCLLLGETGTGKELAARALHEQSPRARRPFLVVDCAAVGAQFIEDKLFGHERGAFTGASQSASGVFEEARGGTVFLDEIGELPVGLQAKLLGVLERREATRIGSHTPIKLDVRLVAATHRDLHAMVRRGSFREDLLYRISEFTLRIPALRDRKEDIAGLARALLESEGQPKALTQDAVDYLESLSWPGNIRELRNLLRRAALLVFEPYINRQALLQLDEHTSQILIPAASRAPAVTDTHTDVSSANPLDMTTFEMPLAEATEAFRKHYILHLRQRFGSDLQRAAEHAGVHPKSVSRLFRLYGVS